MKLTPGRQEVVRLCQEGECLLCRKRFHRVSQHYNHHNKNHRKYHNKLLIEQHTTGAGGGLCDPLRELEAREEGGAAAGRDLLGQAGFAPHHPRHCYQHLVIVIIILVIINEASSSLSSSPSSSSSLMPPHDSHYPHHCYLPILIISTILTILTTMPPSSHPPQGSP